MLIHCYPGANKIEQENFRKEVSRMRIDLGSGENKHRNCIGIDRNSFGVTNIIHDFNRRIPLERDSVSFVMCSHSLEFADNLQAVMQDIYRICRHGAIVCIVAPYAHATANMVNPEIKQLFNEHSPGYWTAHEANELYQDEYPLSGFTTSLKESKTKLPTIDFRLLRMEFFYYPAYHGFYEEVELAYLRQSQLNVAYQIMYHLMVVKKPLAPAELLAIDTEGLEEPDYVKEQRVLQHSDEEQEQPFYLDLAPSASTEDKLTSLSQSKLPIPRKKSTGSKTKPVVHRKSKRRLNTGKQKKPSSRR